MLNNGQSRMTEQTLETRYKDDPELLALYQRKLLIRGWLDLPPKVVPTTELELWVF